MRAATIRLLKKMRLETGLYFFRTTSSNSYKALIKWVNIAFFKQSMLPWLKDRLTISNQMGTNVFRLFFRIEAGTGSSGEQLIPYVAGSNACNTMSLAKETAGSVTVEVRGNVFRMFSICSLKYVWNLSASSSVELWLGSIVFYLIFSNWFTHANNDLLFPLHSSIFLT